MILMSVFNFDRSETSSGTEEEIMHHQQATNL